MIGDRTVERRGQRVRCSAFPVECHPAVNMMAMLPSSSGSAIGIASGWDLAVLPAAFFPSREPGVCGCLSRGRDSRLQCGEVLEWRAASGCFSYSPHPGGLHHRALDVMLILRLQRSWAGRRSSHFAVTAPRGPDWTCMAGKCVVTAPIAAIWQGFVPHITRQPRNGSTLQVGNRGGHVDASTISTCIRQSVKTRQRTAGVSRAYGGPFATQRWIPISHWEMAYSSI